MSTNRPMSEYESAAIFGLEIVFRELVRLRADPKELKRQLNEYAKCSKLAGSSNGAAVYKMLARFVRD